MVRQLQRGPFRFDFGSIGAITTTGQFSFYKGSSILDPVGIALGPDGAMWFTNAADNSIGRITTDGSVTYFPTGGTAPVDITAGLDNAMWFTDSLSGSAIGRMTLAGDVTSYPASGSQLAGAIASGPDGTVWFTTGLANTIGRVSLSPGAPTIGTATAGSQSVSVSWTAPTTDGGSPIEGYVVTPYVGFAPGTPQTFNSTATTETISGLADGTQYRFRVQAFNAVGTGGYSKVSNLVTTATVPDAPTIGTATGGDQSAIVSWAAPASNGGASVTGYIVTPYIGFYPLTPVVFMSTATTETISGLVNGTQYRFRVQAFNAVGTGGYSKVSNPVVPAA